MNDLKKINDITGATKNDLDKYYVYALFEKHSSVPFYIGKGQGTRIFSHQHSAEEMLKMIKLEQANEKYLTKKIEKIIQNNGEIEPVIVKFGLTEEQAFIVESGLINVFNYSAEKSSSDKLTNIVSGHASKKEKSVFSKDGLVKARAVKDFLDNYNIPEFDFSSVSDKKCVLIKINGSYENGNTAEEVYENVRGVWNISSTKRNVLKYAFAMYRGICVGVYTIEGWRKAYDYSEEFPFPQRKDGGAERIIVTYSEIDSLKKDYPVLHEKYFTKSTKKKSDKIQTPQEKLTKWREKHFFYGSSAVPEELRQAIGKRITNFPKRIDSQSPFVFNF